MIDCCVATVLLPEYDDVFRVWFVKLCPIFYGVINKNYSDI